MRKPCIRAVFVLLMAALLPAGALMLLCLRPAFDVLCEAVAFALGGRGDLYYVAQVTGYPLLWLSIAILMSFSVFTIARVLVESASGDRSAAT